jgi:RNA polymerase sigma factor (sigma-70 family)
MQRIFMRAFLITMEKKELLSNLFRAEYQKIVSVLCYRFGIQHIEIAEDIVSDTFLSATELWGLKGLPENPAAWLYTVAKNKTKNHLKRNSIFELKLSPEIQRTQPQITDAPELDLSEKNIADSQLAMIFTVCNPVNPADAQVALALNLLCGFGIPEISDAFLINREVIYKRVQRAKQKLKEENIRIEQPAAKEIGSRLNTVLTTLYLLFSEGYYSTTQHTTIRKEFCAEAMRLTYLLIENKRTNLPEVNALLSLMCFHSSRFEARVGHNGELILYQDQDESLWDTKLIEKGVFFLSKASTGNVITRYHIEAGIAYWHTQKEDTGQKWSQILGLYNNLLNLEYSPIAALNRTFALAKVQGKEAAIDEAEKLNLSDNHFYYSLLGSLYTDLDDKVALLHFTKALALAKSPSDKAVIRKNIEKLKFN